MNYLIQQKAAEHRNGKCECCERNLEYIAHDHGCGHGCFYANKYIGADMIFGFDKGFCCLKYIYTDINYGKKYARSLVENIGMDVY